MWREAYRKELKEEIISEMTGAEMQKIQVARGVDEESDLEFMLDIIAKKQSFGNTDRVITDSLEIQTSPKYSTTIKDIMVRLSRQSRIRGKFIAQGLIRAIGAATYRNVLMENNEFLRNQSTIVVTGVRPELLEFMIDKEK